MKNWIIFLHVLIASILHGRAREMNRKVSNGARGKRVCWRVQANDLKLIFAYSWGTTVFIPLTAVSKWSYVLILLTDLKPISCGAQYSCQNVLLYLVRFC